MSEPEKTQSLDTVIKYEINAIKQSRNFTVNYDMNVTIHTPKGDYPILYPERFDRLKDYVEHFSDVLNITLALPTGTYQYDIFPHKDNLEITLELIPLQSTTMYTRQMNGENIKKRFIAKLTSFDSAVVEANKELDLNKKMSDSHSITTVTFQLLDKVVMALRTKTVGTVVVDTNPMEAIKYFLTEHSKNLDSGDSEMIKGVNVVPGYTEEIRSHIPIQHGTRLVLIPKVIDDICGGMYANGFSYYLKENFWYVFPLYDNTRFSNSDNTLTIINIPANRMPNSDKTFRVTDSQLIVISTGDIKYLDSSIQERDTMGDTVRFVDSRKVIEDFGKTGGNKFITKFDQNVTEATIDKDVKDPTRAAIATQVKVTAAYNKEFSALASRNGSRALITWENSDDSRLYPGMSVRYMFMANGQARQLYGTLLQAETAMFVVNKHPAQRLFNSVTVLTCFLSKDINNTNLE